ncbi:MAG TPA: hypothetical protein VJ735_20275 [Actinomycetes bacterium]|nr:hypothetical protein [Actinomycetes bacterium]
MGHLQRNKKLYSAVAAGIAAFLYAYDLKEAAAMVGMLATGLLGAGALPSDAEARRQGK